MIVSITEVLKALIITVIKRTYKAKRMEKKKTLTRTRNWSRKKMHENNFK